MKRFVLFGIIAVAFVGFGLASGMNEGDGEPPRSATPASYTASRGGTGGSPMERLERSIKMRPGTKQSLGDAFVLASGHRVRLYTAETEDAKSCLLEEHSEAGVGAGCLEDGLFGARKVAFSVNTDGGPQRFGELYVTGIVSHSIRSAELLLADGRRASLELTPQRTFLFEASSSELADGVYPTGIRLFGPNGKLVETVSFPPAGS